VALFYAAISIALAGLTVTVRAQQDKPTLDDLKRLQKAGEKFQTKKFQLLWAREAYRCGNLDGALNGWKALVHSR